MEEEQQAKDAEAERRWAKAYVSPSFSQSRVDISPRLPLLCLNHKSTPAIQNQTIADNWYSQTQSLE